LLKMRKEIVSIPKKVDQEPVVNFEGLRKEGLEHISHLGRKIWTDFNSHDPGVTALEALCYAISDLGYRINLPMEDLLAEDNNNFASMHEKFLSAMEVFPNAPVTINDYRKLFMNRVEVNNAWVEKAHYDLYANCEEGRYDICEPNVVAKQKICLNGLYRFWVELKDRSLVYPSIGEEENIWTEEEKTAIKETLKHIYHENRNIGEDLIDVCWVEDFPVKICGNIKLSLDANLVEVKAQLECKIKEYFSPSVRHYSLSEMLDKGYTTDEIFEGPILNNGEGYSGGFIDNKELEVAGVRRKLHVSDLIRIIMDEPGVELVEGLHIGGCDEDGEEEERWSLCVPEGYKPVVCEESVMNFFKDVIPLEITEEIEDKVQERAYEILQNKLTVSHVKTEDVDMPLGTYFDLDNYTSIQNSFPDTYGINQVGLPTRVGSKRLASAKQLQGYLLFFDQVLASYFSQLGQVKKLLNGNAEVSQTYFTQVITDVKDVEELWKNPNDIEENLNSILHGLDNPFLRTNQLLDHLLARFSVSFNEYVLLMYSIIEESESQEEIEKAITDNKIKFLQNFQELSSERGKAFNYCGEGIEVWNSSNVSGLVKRLAFLSGLDNSDITNLAYSMEYEIYTTPSGNYKYKILDEDGSSLFTTNKNTGYTTVVETIGALYQSLDALENNNVVIKQLDSGNVKVNLLDGETVLASTTKTISNVLAGNELIEYVANLVKNKTDKTKKGGLHVVEHILLRPVQALTTECGEENVFCNVDGNTTLSHQDSSGEEDDTISEDNPANATHVISAENMLKGVHLGVSILEQEGDVPLPMFSLDDCDGCGNYDPYSFKISVVLPGWAGKLANLEYRKFLEKTIRMETPAHVLPKICFVDQKQMATFETTYRAWLNYQNMMCCNVAYRNKANPYTQPLINIIENLQNYYPSNPNLQACDGSNADSLILGRTNL